MGSKLTKAKKKGEGEEKAGQVDKDWSTSTWPRKKKPNFNEFKEDKSGTLGRRGKFGKGSTATLGNDSKLDRKPSFGKRIRASARNWASTKGLYKGSKNQHESEADTKPSSVILGQEEEKELEKEEIIAPVEDEVATSSELDVGALVKELVTQKLKKSKEKADESVEVKVEAQIEANNVKISPRFIEIDSNTAVTTEVYPAENVSQSVCEEDVTAIELIEPGDEIVIATETIVEENENSYTEEKIEVIEYSESSSINKRANSTEILSESVVEENVIAIDQIKNGDKDVTTTECVVQDNDIKHTDNIEEHIKDTDNIDTSSDDNDKTLVMLAVSPSELANDIVDKEETLETSEIGQKAFEINEVPAEVQMEAEENMDSTTPEISHETEIEEASTIPVKTIVEGDTENSASNGVNIEDISIIVEDVLERDEELNTLENVDNVLENKHFSGEINDKNDTKENLDITENKDDTEKINNNYEVDLSAVNNKDDVPNQRDLASGTENGFPSTDKNYIKSNENASEIDTPKEINKYSMTIIEETNDEKEKDEVNISEQLLANLNNHQELKYITEIEEDNTLETVQEIESFQINEEIQEVRFEGSVEFIEIEDQPTRESLTQFEDTPVLETVEEMEEPPMEETETVVLCQNEIAKEWDEGSSLIEKVKNEDSSIPLDHYTIFENENENSVEEDEDDVSDVVTSDKISHEMHSQSENVEVEQKVLELCAKVEAKPLEEIVIGSVTTNDNEEESQDMSDNDMEFSKQVTMEMKETEESEDSMSLEDNIGAQEELVLSEAEEIAQNILDKVFSEITDSAYFEGDDLEGVTAVHEDLLEECIETDIEENVESEIQSSVEENINDKEDCEDEIVKSYKEEFELAKDECQDDSLLDGQNTTPDILELVEEVKESTYSSTESTLQKSTTLESNNNTNHEEIKQIEETEKKIENFQENEEHVDQNEEDLDSPIEEEKNHLDEENELLSQTMQDLSGKLGNTLKLVQEHISVTSDEIVEMEKSKPSDSDFSNLTNTNINYEVSEDGSDEERTDVSTDEGIVASSDEDEKCHGTKEAIEKRPKNKEDLKDSLDNSCSEFK